MRGGTWAPATENISQLLPLTARHAHTGIRFAWLEMISMAILIAITLPIAAPWLAPLRWQHDPALQRLLLLQIGTEGHRGLGNGDSLQSLHPLFAPSIAADQGIVG